MSDKLGLNDQVPLAHAKAGDDTQQVAKPKPLSRYVTEVDRWSRRNGRDLWMESAAIQNSFLKKSPDASNQQTAFSQSVGVPPEKDLVMSHEDCEATVTDVFGALFEMEPEFKPVEKVKDKARHKYLSEMADTVEWYKLRQQTACDHVTSAIASVQVVDTYAKMMRDAGKDENGQQKEPSEKQMTQAISQALTNSQAEVQAFNDMASTMAGMEDGQHQSIQIDHAIEMYKKVRKNRKLQSILIEAGRFIRLAQSIQKRKICHGRDDVVGTKLDGDIGDLIASEFSFLAAGDHKYQLLVDIIEGQAMCREWSSTEKVSKGPIVVYCDESGSMSGQPEIAAKALMLAMLYIGRLQKRWVMLMGFSGPNQQRSIVIEPDHIDQDALLKWLTGFYGGGTCINFLADMPTMLSGVGGPTEDIDLLMITDGAVFMDDARASSFAEWKERSKCRLHTFFIGCGIHGTLDKPLSDHVYSVYNLDTNSEAVEDVLGI